MKKTVAIHQPNYVPWLGFFNKLSRSDVFVFLDDVQFPKTGGNWINRCRINRIGSAHWLTVPVHRPSGMQEIRMVRCASHAWKLQHRRVIHEQYRSAPHYHAVSDLFDEIYDSPDDEVLIKFNLRAIHLISKELGLHRGVRFQLSSELEIGSSSTARLVEIVKAVQGERYLCGGGSANYLDSQEFDRVGLEVAFQNFNEPSYPKLDINGALSGLSIIDALAMTGRAGTCDLISRP